MIEQIVGDANTLASAVSLKDYLLIGADLAVMGISLYYLRRAAQHMQKDFEEALRPVQPNTLPPAPTSGPIGMRADSCYQEECDAYIVNIAQGF